jgi:two-component system, NarL family, response regulator LiaR
MALKVLDRYVCAGERPGASQLRATGRVPSDRVKRTVLLYGTLGGVLITALKLVEYRFLVLEHSLEIYGGIIAVLFSVLGIWLGLKLTRPRETVVVREVQVPVPVEVPVRVEVEVPVPAPAAFERNAARLEQLGITPRELEILEAMAAGLSNREIGERLFVSENTVKTHAARLFDKLGARRRTQAVQLAKEAELIP